MLRSILSVVTGVVVWGVLWVSANAGLAAAFPSRFDESGITTVAGLLLAFLVISSLLSVLAGWLCAVIAPSSLMRHVTVLALVQLFIGIAVQAGVWSLMPVWYHLLFLALVVPMHLVGGRIRVSQEERPGVAPA